MTSIFQCPTCAAPLTRDAGSYRCASGHTFDISREGYVNLLLAHQRNSKEPGDSKEMMAHRSAFFATGRYDRLFDQLLNLPCVTALATGSVLDAGCGEGYFLSRFQSQKPGAHCVGIDISKPGIRFAARRNPRIHWAVASTFDLPILPHSVDIIFQIFAPSQPAELSRVLKKDGMFIKVTPGPKHLFGLKKLIYESPRLQEPDPTPGGFLNIDETHLMYEIELTTAAEITNLLSMTPFYWNIDLATAERVKAQTRLQTAIDFTISIYKSAT